jgi:hypothetical protein
VPIIFLILGYLSGNSERDNPDSPEINNDSFIEDIILLDILDDDDNWR